ncbi:MULTISPECIES: AAA family ATPase [Lachnospiraceae]|uniref:AAA family ATPase n=1 Tax=Lachnospiraceae TaxID=186803 RepID=UPI000E4B6E7C|nr:MULTISPECIES: AAA family ATPase [Lachnospiraceae]RGH84174.1 hypothetical protein DW746_15815 [Blautia sp. AM28-36]RHT61093.1 hypothetical protein DW743_15630 [Blautia sp. AM28-27]RHT79540.1 hypothetical protein DW731_15420 [Blautia sp. AM28-10]
MSKLSIPVGISNFEKIRNGGFYYIDKTGLIAELVRSSAEVTLITRPRRFGKTLGMSMLESFFDIRKDSKKLFDGLEISHQKNLCEKWMNQWPVVFLSLKNVDGIHFSDAYQQLVYEISLLYQQHDNLLKSTALSDRDKFLFKQLQERQAGKTDIMRSLQFLTRLLEQHYGKKVILLIDEYDVPIAKANSHGYYNEMMDVIKGLMQALKDNPSLHFAVITGCLKIAKESIFTGTNNFVSDTITNSRLNEYFGFVQHEVDQLLLSADFTDKASAMKEWYDGYHFGTFDVYCPWDVMNYLLELQRNPQASPVSYWKNTSDNAIIRSFIDYAGSSITKKLETLMAAGSIVQRVDENLTYDYLHSSEDNLWSLLYLTGYLTKAQTTIDTDELPPGMMELKIPNAEIKEIFETTVVRWFDESAKTWNRKTLFDAIWSGDCDRITQELTALLRRTISYHDYREDFYHAFLAGIFTGAGYMVDSNKEHGEGRSDVVLYDSINGRVAVFEAKYTKALENLSSACDSALQQMNEKLYAKEYEDDYDQIFCYGISFFKKRCLVKKVL